MAANDPAARETGPDAGLRDVPDAREPSARSLVEVSGLGKEYGENVALRDVSFSVEEGEIFGFIGPNGAGKTTTIRILATLLEPTAGEARIDGLCVQNDAEEVRRIIGYMPDQFGVYDGLTADEYLEFFARAYRVPAARRRAIIEDVVELTDLGELRSRLVSEFSKGMKQRLCLAKTLVHDPKLLILDEPASALDPRARIELRALLKELRGLGKTVFISSHILTELADICTSVGILERGRLVESGPVDGLSRAADTVDRVEVTLARECPQALEALRESPRVRAPSMEGTRLRFEYDGPREDFWEVIRLLVERRVPVVSVRHDERDLESVFLELTKGDVQ